MSLVSFSPDYSEMRMMKRVRVLEAVALRSIEGNVSCPNNRDDVQ
jgi:hypothetical protein